MGKGWMEFSITSLEILRGEILNKIAIFIIFLHKIKLHIFWDNSDWPENYNHRLFLLGDYNNWPENYAYYNFQVNRR